MLATSKGEQGQGEGTKGAHAALSFRARSPNPTSAVGPCGLGQGLSGTEFGSCRPARWRIRSPGSSLGTNAARGPPPLDGSRAGEAQRLATCLTSDASPLFPSARALLPASRRRQRGGLFAVKTVAACYGRLASAHPTSGHRSDG